MNTRTLGEIHLKVNVEVNSWKFYLKEIKTSKKNAYPNWRRSNYSSWEFKTYSEMYKNSADVLIDSIGENKGYIGDERIIPVIYLYRHSTELILKAMLLTHYLMNKKNDT